MHYSLRTQLQEAFESYGKEEPKPVVADADSGFKQVLETKPEGTEEVVEKGCDPKGKKPMADAKDGDSDTENPEEDMSEEDMKKMKDKMKKAEPRFAATSFDHHVTVKD